MEILLVRHGQTSGNVAHIHQAEHTPISPKGKEESKKVAEVIKKLSPTHLVTSNLVRAVQTASIIGEVCDLIPETNPVFIELVRPDDLYGYRHRSLKSVWFYIQWFLGRDIGGESYDDLLVRIKIAKELISQYPSDSRLVIVSHTVFINIFLAHLCRKKKLTFFNAVLIFKKIVTMPNTHVTKLRFGSREDI